MFHLNIQEIKCIVIVCCVVSLGSVCNLVFKKYPKLYDIVNAIENEQFYPCVNINSATKEQLVAIPYIGEYTAENIIHYRQTHDGFSSLEELKNVKGIRGKNYDKFINYLTIK